MRLSKLKISNFRCYGAEEVVIDFEDITTFIGANSTGKSTALQALIKLFGDTIAERTLEKTDFHTSYDEVVEDKTERKLYLEANFSFSELENDEDEMSYAIPAYFDNFVVEAPKGSPYLRIRLDATWKQGNTPDGIVESKINYIYFSEEDEEKSARISSSDLSQIKIIYVPAIRNPSVLLRNATGTLLWRVLKSIKWSEQTKTDIKDQLQQAEEVLFAEAGLEKIRESLKKHWKEYHRDTRYSEANIRFNSTDLDQLIKKFEVDFLPSVTKKAYSVDALGDGLRSLFYLSLVNAFLEIEQQAIKDQANFALMQAPILTILAIEEPENHVSPHLLGNIINNLKKISKKINSQVVLTSHTPAIVKRVEPETIRYFNIPMNNPTTQVKKIILPLKNGSTENEEAYKYVKEAVKAYPELYFAKLVVLGEGDSEEIIIPKAIELSTEEHIDGMSISVVPLGGRHVNHFWRLLNELQIPHLTLLDLDKERSGGGWGRIQYALNELIKLGVEKEKLLTTTNGGILDINKFQTWNEKSIKNQEAWMNHLDGFNVFFSSPLDLDFMMLENFSQEYKSILNGNEGPQIKGLGKIIDLETEDPSPEYTERLKISIKHTLKTDGGNGETYDEVQKQLMIWYDYFFLQRGKPVTHLLALAKMGDQKFKDNLPDPLSKLVLRVKEKLTTTQEEVE